MNDSEPAQTYRVRRWWGAREVVSHDGRPPIDPLDLGGILRTLALAAVLVGIEIYGANVVGLVLTVVGLLLTLLAVERLAEQLGRPSAPTFTRAGRTWWRWVRRNVIGYRGHDSVRMGSAGMAARTGGFRMRESRPIPEGDDLTVESLAEWVEWFRDQTAEDLKWEAQNRKESVEDTRNQLGDRISQVQENMQRRFGRISATVGGVDKEGRDKGFRIAWWGIFLALLGAVLQLAAAIA